MNENLYNKKILISGAGISGLTLAYWLKQYGFTPTVIERADSLRTGGYKVDIRGSALEVIRKMDIHSAVCAIKTDIKGATVVDSQGNKITEMSGDTFNLRESEDLEIMRGDLCQIIKDRLDGVEIIFGETLTKLSQENDGVHVEFSKSPSKVFDLVIGADGLHSNVRRLAFGEESLFIHHLNMYISIFTIPNYLNLDRLEIECSEDKKLVNLYSIGGNHDAKAAFLFCHKDQGIDPGNIKKQKELLKQVYSDMHWEIPKLLDLMNDAPDFYFDSIAQIHMEHWFHDRVVLVGDAGYCASPVSGQGTSLALIGAYVLAGELFNASGDYTKSFRRYEEELQEYVKKNQKWGQVFAKNMTMENKNKLAVWFHDQMMRIMPGKLTDYLTKKSLEKVTQAANAIKIKNYK